jgi:repressor LexA
MKDPMTGQERRQGLRGLTPRQRLILDTISESFAKRGYPPSMREIGAAVGLASPSSVKYQLSTMERKGYLRRDPNRPRAMEIVDPESDLPVAVRQLDDSPAKPRYVPVVKHVTAGTPVVAEEQVKDAFPLPRQLVGGGELFALKVKDDSMKGAAILKGDWVVVKAQAAAEDGDTVAALIGDKATIKTFSVIDRRAWLVSADDATAPVEGHKAQILGKVTCILRSLV